MARRRSSRGFNRQVRRKFVWNRTFGTTAAGDTGVDLLASFRDQPGATHLGATVTRIRGQVIPVLGAVAAAGTVGFRIDSWNEPVQEVTNQPEFMPDEDWLGWLPWNVSLVTAREFEVTWNEQASLWAVDIKAQRKLEELNQTLWMFLTQSGGADRQYAYNLSIGLKLP